MKLKTSHFKTMYRKYAFGIEARRNSFVACSKQNTSFRIFYELIEYTLTTIEA